MHRPETETRRRRLAGWYGRLPRRPRRAVAATVGFAMVLIGVALLALPGPGIAVAALGLAILALEFPWARSLAVALRRWLERGLAALRRFVRWLCGPASSPPR